MRVLVTGSRTWTDRNMIHRLLHKGWMLHPDLIVVHGDCPEGADRIADEIALRYGMTIQRYPADWNTHGKRAGFIRNAQMVDTTPDMCLAFIHNYSRGASMCAELAEKAGIPTFRFLQETS